MPTEMARKWSSLYTRSLSLSEYLENLHVHLPLLVEIIREKPRRILEVGTGSGSMSIFLSHLGYDVTSIDNDEYVVDWARELCERLSGNVTFMIRDASDLCRKFQKAEFDIVFSQGFFEHFSDSQIRLLLSEQLNVGKVVLFSVPSEYYPERWNNLGNERFLSAEEWARILYELDCNIDFIRYYGKRLVSLRGLIKSFVRKPSFSLLKPLHISVRLSRSNWTSPPGAL